MVPPAERFGHIESSAESRVAHLLSQVQLGEKAVCFYSVHLPRHEYKRMSEIDFLIILRDLVLVLEIKGGRLSRRNGIWSFTDRYGQTNEKREGPFDQARSAMFALERSLRERIPGLSMAFGATVVTPDQPLDRDLEWDPAEHIGPSSMTVKGLEDALQSSIRFWRERSHSHPRPEDQQAVLDLIRPDFDRVPRLSLLVGVFESDFITLAAEQYNMLRGSELNDRIYCTGGAGSGKTLLAVETARRASRNGSRTLLTCRSLGVIDMMRRSLGEEDVTCLPWSQTPDLDPFDVVVVDEAQDLMNIDDCLVLEQLVRGGLRDGKWRMFADPNNQAHIEGAFDQEVYQEILERASRYHLPYNCRNTSSIVTQTQLLIGADLGIAKAGEGPAVEFNRPSTQQEAAALLSARLKRFRQEEIDLSDVVVITLRDRVDDSAALQSKAYRQGYLVADAESQEAGTARLVTTSQFKGLEAPHAVVIDVDQVSTTEQMSRLYVAMTRPRISLSLLVGPLAWQQLSQPDRGKSDV